MKKSREKVLLILLILSGFIQLQAQSIKQKDSTYLSHPFQDKVQKIKKSLAKTFIDFVGNDISLFGSLDFTKQNINDNRITAPLNYLYNNVNENAFKPGFTGGFRIDGIYKEKHRYTLSFAVNRIAAGNYYQNKHNYKTVPHVHKKTPIS